MIRSERRARRPGPARGHVAAMSARFAATPLVVTALAATVLVVIALAAILIPGAPGGAVLAAGSGQQPTFAETFARAGLVVVATVEDAPPADDAYRLSVETSLKGGGGGTLTFPAGATSLDLTAGSRIVLLAMDPTTLDFRGTVALVVAPDGAIDPDGLAGVPPTVEALVAAYGTTEVTTAPTATEGDGAGLGIPWGAVLVLAVVACVAAVVVAAVGGRRA